MSFKRLVNYAKVLLLAFMAVYLLPLQVKAVQQGSGDSRKSVMVNQRSSDYKYIYSKNGKKYALYQEFDGAVKYYNMYEVEWVEEESWTDAYLPIAKEQSVLATEANAYLDGDGYFDPTKLGYTDIDEYKCCMETAQGPFYLCLRKASSINGPTTITSEEYAYRSEPKTVEKKDENGNIVTDDEGNTVYVAETYCYIYQLSKYNYSGNDYYVVSSTYDTKLWDEFEESYQPEYVGMELNDYYKQVILSGSSGDGEDINIIKSGINNTGKLYSNGIIRYDDDNNSLIMKNVDEDGILHIKGWLGNFTIQIEGDNSIGGIAVEESGEMVLKIEGKGKLSVNKGKAYDNAIEVIGYGYSEQSVVFGDMVALSLYAKDNGNAIMMEKTTVDAADKVIVWPLKPESFNAVQSTSTVQTWGGENNTELIDVTCYNYIVTGTQIGLEPPHEHTAAAAWSSDAVDHWKICAECREKLEETIAAHTASDWKYEGDYHWKECTVCGLVIGESEKHSFDAGTVTKNATETEAGIMTYTCKCGYTKTEAIPKTEPANPSDNIGTGSNDTGSTGGDAAGKDNAGGASTSTDGAGKTAVAAGTEAKDDSGATFTVKDTSADTASDTVEVEYKAADTTQKTVTIPSTVTVNGVEATVTSIADSAFAGNKTVTTVTIPSTVEDIGDNAFKGCTKLTTVSIPESVEEIGSSAFENCTSLKKVTIPKNTESVGKNAFAGCSSLTTVTIKSTTITKIDQGAFKNCKKLTKITITKNVTTIGKEAFSGDKKLKTITITSTKLKSVGKNAFKNVPKSTTIKVPKKQKKAYTKLLKKAGFKGKVK